MLAYVAGFGSVLILLGNPRRTARHDMIDIAWLPACLAVVATLVAGATLWGVVWAGGASGSVAGLLWSSRHLRRTDLAEQPRRAGPDAAFEVEAIYSHRGMARSLARTVPVEPGETVLVAQRVLRRSPRLVRPLGGRAPWAAHTSRLRDLLVHWASSPVP